VATRHLAALALAATAVAANFTNYGPLIPELRGGLHASAAQIGLLSTLLYVGIGITYLPGGMLVDRIGPRRVLCLALLLVGVGGGLVPAVPHLAWAITCRLVVGLGAGVAILAGSQAARHAGRAALGQGVFGGAMQAGAGAGLFATPTLAAPAGWHGAFAAWALLALAASAACRLLMLSDPPPAAIRQRRFATAVRSRPLWRLGLVHLATLGLGQATAPWLGVYLATTYRQLSLAHAAQLGAAGLLLGALVRPLGGALISQRHVRHQTLQRVGTLFTAAGLAALAAPHQRAWLTAAGLMLFTAGTTLPYASVFDQAGRIGEAAAFGPGAAQGIVSTISAPASAGGPPLIGWLLERSGSYTSPFAALALVGLVGCAGAVAAGGRVRRASRITPSAELEVPGAAAQRATALAAITAPTASRPDATSHHSWRPSRRVGSHARRPAAATLVAVGAVMAVVAVAVLLSPGPHGSGEGSGNGRIALAAGPESRAGPPSPTRPGRPAGISSFGAAPPVQQLPLPTDADAVIPTLALRAYREAESWAAGFDPTCKLPWSVLAGIGRIESNHGRHLGEAARFSPAGDVTPTILGPVLNGSGGTAAIPDTDSGRWDGDVVWDHAVGPMQFIPSTWASLGRDGTGDGLANPNNLFDAAVSAAGYLCLNRLGPLTDDANLRGAIYAYNHSREYVSAVITWANFYQQRAGLGSLATVPMAVGPASSGVAGTAARASNSGPTPVASGTSRPVTATASSSGPTTTRAAGSTTTKPSSTTQPPTTATTTTTTTTTTASSSTAPTTTTSPPSTTATTAPATTATTAPPASMP